MQKILVIPSIDIKNRKTVRVVKGIPELGCNSYGDDPVEMAMIWRAENAKVLHVVDFDSSHEHSHKNFDLLGEICDSVIIPVQCEYYALEGLGLLTKTLRNVRSSFNPDLEIEGIILTMFDPRNNLSREVATEVRRHFGNKVYKTVIHRNVTLGEAPSYGKPILLYDIRSKGAQGYLSLAKEILNEDGIGQRT